MPTAIASVPDDHIRAFTVDRPCHDTLYKAYLILKYAHESAHALLEALRLVRANRDAQRGGLTDEEQDLLRATIVMAASGLDAMTKQMIRDTLPTVCACDESAAAKFETFTARKIRGDADGIMTNDTSKLLARVLMSDSPRQAFAEEYIRDLTGGSLQSVDELHRVAGALGIPSQIIDRDLLKPIFTDRNAIIHELDIDFTAPRRNRKYRPMGRMITSANRLLQVAELLYLACEEKLNA